MSSVGGFAATAAPTTQRAARAQLKPEWCDGSTDPSSPASYTVPGPRVPQPGYPSIAPPSTLGAPGVLLSAVAPVVPSGVGDREAPAPPRTVVLLASLQSLVLFWLSGSSCAAAHLPSSRPLPRPSHARRFWPGAAAALLRAVMWRGSVLQQRRTTHRPPARTLPGASTTAGQTTTSQTLAYAHCMRSHGVPAFPDPDSSGEIPKTQVVSARQSNPSRFDSANSTCRHLLPNGGNGETRPRSPRIGSRLETSPVACAPTGCRTGLNPPADPQPIGGLMFSLTAVGIDGIRRSAGQRHSNARRGTRGLPPAR